MGYNKPVKQKKEACQKATVKLTKNNFEQEVIKSDVPVLIDFWASWCGPCRMISPVIEEIAQEVTDKKVCKVNIDEEPELAQAFSVMSIPTLVVVKNGKVVNQAVGARPKEEIMRLLG